MNVADSAKMSEETLSKHVNLRHFKPFFPYMAEGAVLIHISELALWRTWHTREHRLELSGEDHQHMGR